MRGWLWACSIVVCFVCASPALAQETRARQLERQRAERAAVVEPYKPTKLERYILFVEEKRLLERFGEDVNGIYPRAGSFTSGGGIGFGAGARYHTGNGQLYFDVSGATSLKKYKVMDASIEAPKLLRGLLSVEGALQWTDFTEQDFFGLGSDSSLDNRTNFRIVSTDLSGTVRVRPKPWLSVGQRTGVLRPEIRSGFDSRFPSTEAMFTEETAPGLEDTPSRLRYGAWFVDVDHRDRPRNTRRGGHYRFEVGMYRDGSSPGFNFNRMDFEASHVFPIFDAKRNIAVRLLLSEVDEIDAGDRVPFFLLPTIGGSNTLRGFRDLRFRDASIALFNVEYRWEALSGVDLALFYDTGDVAPEWGKLGATNIKKSYGAGVRVHTNKRVFLRFDVGTGGGEGLRLFFKLGPSF